MGVDPKELESLANIGATGIISLILMGGLYVFYKAITKYLEDKREEDKIEKEYYRKKIDEKDEKLEESAKKTDKIVEKFTEVIEKELNSVKYGVKRLTDKIIKNE